MKPPRTTVAIRRSRADAASADPSRDGLTDYYTALLRGYPAIASPLLKLLPNAVRDLLSPNSLGVSTIAEGFLTDLLAAKRCGMLRGLREYVREPTSNNRHQADVFRSVMSDR
jgi:hypothetical protein